MINIADSILSDMQANKNGKPVQLASINRVESLLIVQTLNECLEEAAKTPIPQMLFSEFWFEGELCVLFADTNLGKTILATQIADSITTGKAIKGFKLEASSQNVLILDFELTGKQLENRYSNEYQDHYQFDKKLYRASINPNFVDYNKFEEDLFTSIEQSINELKIKVLIVDNITYLRDQSTDTAKEAQPLMKRLKKLKAKYNLSILVLAHTPKRSMEKPLTKNDLAGSKQIANFADSIFAIGESFNDSSLRYLKQLKMRNTEHVYNGENVIVCQITKEHNFLGFEYLGTATEAEHLKPLSDTKKSEIDAQILHLKQEGLSNSQIAKQLGTNKMKVKRVLDKALTNSNSSNTW